MKNFNDTLTNEEKILYKQLLNDISKNEKLYSNSSPEEILSHLVDDCGFDKKSIYKLLKKITLFNE